MQKFRKKYIGTTKNTYDDVISRYPNWLITDNFSKFCCHQSIFKCVEWFYSSKEMQLDNLNLGSILFRDCSWHLYLLNHSGILISGRKYAEKVIGTYKQDIFSHVKKFLPGNIFVAMVYGQRNSIVSNLSFLTFLATIIKNCRKDYWFISTSQVPSRGFRNVFMAAILKKKPPSSHVFPTWLFHIEKNPTNEASLNKIKFEISYLSL